MSDLLLKNLEVDNFRTFDHLEIERLGRVNLITGRNNVGKSSLLEALWLYARRGNAEAIRDLLIQRDEVSTQEGFSSRNQSVITPIPSSEQETIENVKYLFHDYRLTTVSPPPIYIGPVKAAKAVKLGSANSPIHIGMDWYIVREAEDEETPPRFVKVDADKRLQFEDAALYFIVTSGRSRVRFKLDRLFRRSSLASSLNEIRSQYIKTEGLSARETSAMWNDIQLTDAEKSVLEAVRLIAPEIERISVRSEQVERRKPIPIIRIKGQEEPLPLRILGDGVNRLFGLTLALINAKDGILLVDEIENGIHYSVFKELWRFLFEAASQFNVQIFATTHSLDCIRSFQKSAQESPEEGFLVRLKNRQGTVAATSLTEEELALAARDDVEVR